MKRFGSTVLVLLATVQMVVAPALADTSAATTLPAGTQLYLTLDEAVSSARGGDDVGTVVRCRVWRDVAEHGVVFIKGGTPATCRVDKVSRRNMGGFEGKVSIAAVETKSTDDQSVMLSGGYNKEGSGHKAVVWVVGLLLLWPVLFVPGGNAELPPGTVFDASSVNDLTLSAPPAQAPRVDLRSIAGGLSAAFMLDDFASEPKHDVFRIKVSKDGQLPDKLVIDSVNGKPVDAIPLALGNATSKDGTSTAVAEVGAKVLAKYFVRGINRFEVSYSDAGTRQATEVVMDVQM